MWSSQSENAAADSDAARAKGEDLEAEAVTAACMEAANREAVTADSGAADMAEAVVEAAGIHETKEAAAGKEGNIPSVFFF